MKDRIQYTALLRWCLEEMVKMADNHRKVLSKKWCDCNDCPVCYSKRALDYDFTGEEYLDVFTEALNTVSKGEITEGLYIAVEVFREKVATPPERQPRDRRGRSPSVKSKGRPRGTG
tara:strand:+ start:193 stop:543 length:351 start_codon:yes stop_codon:yes gene_type:complete